MSTITQRRGGDPKSWMARTESAVFQDGAQSLFVPLPGMWTVHDTASPRAVLDRAGLGLRMWEQWQSQWGRDHPLLAWLYDHPGGRRDHDCVELPEGFSISPAMKAFREHSSGYKITKKVGRKPIDYWMRKHGELEWFRGWLLRGEDQPKGLRIATADQVHRAAKAFDYVSHCHRAGIDADVTYRSWIIDGLIPNLNWLQWLYGWPVPQYTFVVQTPLQALRKEMAIWGLCEAAGTTDKVYRNWNSAEFKDVVEELKKEAARRPGDPDKLPTLQGAWEQLPLQTKRSLWRFALAADPKACRKRAGLTEQAYLGYLRDARRCGVDFQLEQYLNRTGSFGPTKSRQAGLLAPKFFVPTPSMLSFREVALKELTRLEIFHEIARLPCFDLWFKHMTIPGEVRGQRHKLLDERSPGQERNCHGHYNGNPHGATGGEPMPSAASRLNAGAAKQTQKIERKDPWMEQMEGIRMNTEAGTSRDRPLFVVALRDPEKTVGDPGAPVKYPDVREFVDQLRAGPPKLTWKRIFEKCGEKFKRDEMPPDANSLKDYCRPPRLNKIVGN